MLATFQIVTKYAIVGGACIGLYDSIFSSLSPYGSDYRIDSTKTLNGDVHELTNIVVIRNKAKGGRFIPQEPKSFWQYTADVTSSVACGALIGAIWPIGIPFLLYTKLKNSQSQPIKDESELQELCDRVQSPLGRS